MTNARNNNVFSPLKTLPEKASYGPQDVLILFGELFGGGYANGLVNEAQKRGMKVIYSTVGRRDKETNTLRPLNVEELALAPSPLINIPLEAGCDMEPNSSGSSPAEQMASLKIKDWESFQLNWQEVEESRLKASQRFRNNTQAFLQEAKEHIPPGANVIFAHLMAGGVPRAKISMPIINRVFKGVGDRHIPSEHFYQSDLGKFSLINFEEVTAQTLKHLLEESQELKNKITAQGGRVSYIAYGYHGTEILVKNQFQWQTYTPYFQGWAKMALEDIARDFSENRDTEVCVFNCPEILTNSSSVFNGVELSLYPLLAALKKYEDQPEIAALFKQCFAMLKDDVTLEKILTYTDEYITSELIQTHSDFDKWPQNSSQEQMEKMLNTSLTLRQLHKNEKELITFPLSEVVFAACGRIMLDKSWSLENSTWWIGHDIIAETFGMSS